MEILENKKRIEINGREFWIRKFSIKQSLRLGKMLVKIVIEGADKMKGIAETLKKSKDNISDMLTILDVLDEDSVCEVVAIFIDTDDVKFVKENVAGLELTGIIADVLELNDFGVILKNLLRAVDTIQKQTQTLDKKTSSK